MESVTTNMSSDYIGRLPTYTIPFTLLLNLRCIAPRGKGKSKGKGDAAVRLRQFYGCHQY